MTTPNMIPDEAEGWRPDSGDVLIGTVEDIDIGWSDHRGEYPIITIRAMNGTKSANVKPGEAVKVHCFHDVLYGRVMTLRPAPGETVGLQFHGKFPHKSKPNQTVSRYTFKVQGRAADAASLYDRMSAPKPRPAAMNRPPSHGGFQPHPEPVPAADGPAPDDDIPF